MVQELASLFQIQIPSGKSSDGMPIHRLMERSYTTKNIGLKSISDNGRKYLEDRGYLMKDCFKIKKWWMEKEGAKNHPPLC